MVSNVIALHALSFMKLGIKYRKTPSSMIKLLHENFMHTYLPLPKLVYLRRYTQCYRNLTSKVYLKNSVMRLTTGHTM